jgi:non-canonical purine NTP pyrophosphatase (RdgB/HAM1 family)
VAVQRLSVDSTDIVSIGYDPKARVLEIEFKEGRIYQYTDVAADVYERFMRADSYGGYFNSFINGHYRYDRVKEDNEQKPAAQSVAFVSGNADKLRALLAACEPFGIEVEQVDLPIDEIQSHDPEKIALHKAKQAHKLAGRPVLVQDTYWNILALRGFPGAYMHHVADWLRPEDFLALLSRKPDRTVIRTHTLVYYDGKRSKVFSRDFTGVIIDEPRGKGHSIEQLVVTSGQTRTNAEISETKQDFSIPTEETAWHEFAKWYNLQRRLGKV